MLQVTDAQAKSPSVQGALPEYRKVFGGEGILAQVELDDAVLEGRSNQCLDGLDIVVVDSSQLPLEERIEDTRPEPSPLHPGRLSQFIGKLVQKLDEVGGTEPAVVICESFVCNKLDFSQEPNQERAIPSVNLVCGTTRQLFFRRAGERKSGVFWFGKVGDDMVDENLTEIVVGVVPKRPSPLLLRYCDIVASSTNVEKAQRRNTVETHV